MKSLTISLILIFVNLSAEFCPCLRPQGEQQKEFIKECISNGLLLMDTGEYERARKYFIYALAEIERLR